MFDQYMNAFYIGSLIFAAVAVIAAVFARPISQEMAEVEELASGHNVPH